MPILKQVVFFYIIWTAPFTFHMRWETLRLEAKKEALARLPGNMAEAGSGNARCEGENRRCWGCWEKKTRCDVVGMYTNWMIVSSVLDLHLCPLPLLRKHVGFFQHGGQKPTLSGVAGWTSPGTRSELAATIGRTRLMATCQAATLWPLWGPTVSTRHHGNLEMDSK